MTTDPAITALADQIHAECTKAAMQMIENLQQSEGIRLSEDERDAAEMGVNAGYITTLLILSKKGWLREDLIRP